MADQDTGFMTWQLIILWSLINNVEWSTKSQNNLKNRQKQNQLGTVENHFENHRTITSKWLC